MPKRMLAVKIDKPNLEILATLQKKKVHSCYQEL